MNKKPQGNGPVASRGEAVALLDALAEIQRRRGIHAGAGGLVLLIEDEVAQYAARTDGIVAEMARTGRDNRRAPEITPEER